MHKKVAVALSGGVDSSVVAYLLKQRGYEVIGLTAKTTCTPEADLVVQRAGEVAKKLHIPFFSLDVSTKFQEKVIDYYESSYSNAETPNPCIMCNKHIKWGILAEYALQTLEADSFATGHYAKICNCNGTYKLYPASDEHKDQLYFLFMLNQAQLAKTLFPLSDFTKAEVKQIANENNLPSKSSKESQDICFIQKPMTTKKYLNNIFPPKTGLFIDISSGKKLGTHSGFWQYTIGQRKGIGIAASEPLYVVSVNAKDNIVYIGSKKELYTKDLTLNNVMWSYPFEEKSFEAKAKIRYNMDAVPVICNRMENNQLHIEFKQEVSAIAKGQACVLYDSIDGHLLGGAII